jgi:hypothetical protein
MTHLEKNITTQSLYTLDRIYSTASHIQILHQYGYACGCCRCQHVTFDHVTLVQDPSIQVAVLRFGSLTVTFCPSLGFPGPSSASRSHHCISVEVGTRLAQKQFHLSTAPYTQPLYQVTLRVLS